MEQFKMNSKAVEKWIINSFKRLIMNYRIENKSTKADAIEKAKTFLKQIYYIIDKDIEDSKSETEINNAVQTGDINDG